MEKNKEYLGEVLSLGSEGEGIIKCDGVTAFVPFCLAGERVSFRALKVGKTVAYGKLTEVHTLSPDRVAPHCPHFEKCGGCQLQHVDYSAQLAFKRQLVANCLKKIGGLDAEVGQTVASVKQYAYRNKLALPVGTDDAGNTIVGFYAPRSHRIIPIQSCAIQAEWSAALIAALTQFMEEAGLKGYDERTKTGDIRHIVGRELDGRLIITLVTVKKIPLDCFVKKLSQSFKKFTLWNNVNSGAGNGIFGKEWHICFGEGFFEGEDEGLKFKAGANTFLQVNDGVRKLLYAAVCEELCDGETVAIDLYSGGGMLTAMLARVCKAAYGIEIVPEAVDCANELKKINGLGEKMFNYCGAVEDRIEEVFAKTAGYRRAIVCDPPRKGMERSVIREILNCKAEKVVLISCNPATLARDLGLLCGSLIEQDGKLIKNPAYTNEGLNGYFRITKISPFDMFPQTKHVETLVVLSRKNA